MIDNDIDARLPELPGWRREGHALVRVYDTDTWGATLMLVNAIAYLAEAMDHHPELHVTLRRLTVTLTTHSSGGITEKDFALAHRIEGMARWRRGGQA
jgi:4a-hydroxytetrahydrobiopterin dehydratase